MKTVALLSIVTLQASLAAVVNTTYLRMGEDGTNDGSARPLNQATGDVGGSVFNSGSSWSGITQVAADPGFSGAANTDAYANFNGSNPLWGGSLTSDGLTNDNFGIEFWFRQDAVSVGQTEFMFVSNSDTTNSLKVGIRADGLLDASLHNVSGIGGAPAISLGEWYHVAVIRDAGTSSLYLNGVVQAGTTTSAPNISGTGFRIAETPGNSGAQFVGAIDEFRAFNFDAGEGALAVASLNTARIPEPGNFAMLSIAGLSALVLRRRRKDGCQ